MRTFSKNKINFHQGFILQNKLLFIIYYATLLY